MPRGSRPFHKERRNLRRLEPIRLADCGNRSRVPTRRGGRVVEGNGLENRSLRKRTAGSNPVPSAINNMIHFDGGARSALGQTKRIRRGRASETPVRRKNPVPYPTTILPMKTGTRILSSTFLGAVIFLLLAQLLHYAAVDNTCDTKLPFRLCITKKAYFLNISPFNIGLGIIVSSLSALILMRLTRKDQIGVGIVKIRDWKIIPCFGRAPSSNSTASATQPP